MAVLTSWLVVGGSLSVLAAMRGGYQIIPFYLLMMAIGGTIPALICAWLIRNLAKVTGLNVMPIWILRGRYLGLVYAFMSRLLVKNFIGYVFIDSLEGFASFVIFGPLVLLEIGYIGIAIIIFAGMINGAALFASTEKINFP